MVLSFVIPCYRSSKTIGKVVSEITQTLSEKQFEDYEIILVNDASPDNTYEVIEKLANADKHIRGFDLSKNKGQPSAILCGFSYAQGDFVVCGDDDGQTPYNMIFELLDKLKKESYDIVCGKYITRDQPSFFRRVGTKINEKMSEFILDKPKGLYLSAYFIARRFVIDEIIKYKNPYPYLAGLILRTTQKIGNVEVPQRKRITGQSGYSFKKLFSLWINGFTAFSVKPLRVATFLGFILALIGFVCGIIFIINKLINPSIAMGWTSLSALLLFLSGIIMIMLGMIGEYIGRIYISINNSPQYVIRQSTSDDDNVGDNIE